tara:strand:- start:892 stop:1464 length:573 start_codon:yes stop_codon:yes gene_type:complete
MRTTGKSGFKMRSGNKPTFEKMGSSPANMRTFGIGKGTSPYKETDYVEMQKKSAEIDPRYGEMSLEEYTAEVKRQVESKKKTGSYDANKTLDKNNEPEKTNVEKKNEELNPADLTTEKEAKQGSGRLGQLLSGIGKVGVAGLTGGLDAVYGTGKIQFAPGGTRLITKNVEDKNKNKSVDDTEKEIEEKLS